MTRHALSKLRPWFHSQLRVAGMMRHYYVSRQEQCLNRQETAVGKRMVNSSRERIGIKLNSFRGFVKNSC